MDRVGGGFIYEALIYGLLSFNEDCQKTLILPAASALKTYYKRHYNQMGVDEVLNLMNGNSSGRAKKDKKVIFPLYKCHQSL